MNLSITQNQDIHLESLISGLSWILSLQNNEDGGWPLSAQQGSNLVATGHVTHALIRMFGPSLTSVETGLNYLEQRFTRRETGAGYWPRQDSAVLTEPDHTHNLLCCFDILKARQLGRKKSLIPLSNALETAKSSIEYHVKLIEASPESYFWETMQSTFLLEVGDFDPALKKEILSIAEDRLRRNFVEGTHGDVAACAQLGLALLQTEGFSNTKLIVQAVNKLAAQRVRHEHGIFWSHINPPSGGGGELIQTRWVLWFLIECWSRGIKADLQLDGIIEDGLSWFAHTQNDDGSWNAGETIFSPNYIAYVLLALWKWQTLKPGLEPNILKRLIERRQMEISSRSTYTDQPPRTLPVSLAGPTDHIREQPNYAFVLIPFGDPVWEDAFDGFIRPSAVAAGYTCDRVKDIGFEGRISQKILHEILRAGVIIAEMSSKNPNVYYEVGIAHAIGKTVILLTREGVKIPFDLQDMNHIVYDRLGDLSDQIRDRLNQLRSG